MSPAGRWGAGGGGEERPTVQGSFSNKDWRGRSGASRVGAASVLPRAAGDTVWQSGEHRVEDSEGVHGALEKCWSRWGIAGSAGEVLVPLGKYWFRGGSTGPTGEVLVPRGKCRSCLRSAGPSGEVQVARRNRPRRPSAPPRPQLSSQADLPAPFPETVR